MILWRDEDARRAATGLIPGIVLSLVMWAASILLWVVLT